MKDVREFTDAEARLWHLCERWRGTPSQRTLLFQTLGETRLAPYRERWDELPNEELLKILETEAKPERAGGGDEGLHGISDAPGG